MIPSHELYEPVKNSQDVREKKAVRYLYAYKMKKNDPTLTTWNTLKTSLFQFKESTLQVVRTDSARSSFKRMRKIPP